jgi:TonB family protein
LTDLIVTENLQERGEITKSVSDFVSHQFDEAKRTLDDQDAKIAVFKKRYMGRLPTDTDNNMHMLMTLEEQRDANAQNLSRAQRDKAYAESVLAHQVAAEGSSRSSTSPQTASSSTGSEQIDLTYGEGTGGAYGVGDWISAPHAIYDPDPDYSEEARQARLQGTLLLWAIVGPDGRLHDIRVQRALGKGLDEKAVEVLKTWRFQPGKKDDRPVATMINVEVAFRLDEPPEIPQLRQQIQQYQGVIEQAILYQKRLQSDLNLYESRIATSPDVEQQYKLLTRDGDNNEASYKDLLAKQSAAELSAKMEAEQLSEQMKILTTAGVADSPDFPNRPLFALWGLYTGVLLEIGRVLWPAARKLFRRLDLLFPFDTEIE